MEKEKSKAVPKEEKKCRVYEVPISTMLSRTVRVLAESASEAAETVRDNLDEIVATDEHNVSAGDYDLDEPFISRDQDAEDIEYRAGDLGKANVVAKPDGATPAGWVITVSEELRTTVDVPYGKVKTSEEAEKAVRDAYGAQKIILTSDDYVGKTDFLVDEVDVGKTEDLKSANMSLDKD